jgi:hypothetical protein
LLALPGLVQFDVIFALTKVGNYSEFINVSDVKNSSARNVESTVKRLLINREGGPRKLIGYVSSASKTSYKFMTLFSR